MSQNLGISERVLEGARRLMLPEKVAANTKQAMLKNVLKYTWQNSAFTEYMVNLKVFTLQAPLGDSCHHLWQPYLCQSAEGQEMATI